MPLFIRGILSWKGLYSGEGDFSCGINSWQHATAASPPDSGAAWSVLPAALMYRIRELPILVNEADKYVASVWEHDWSPDYSRTFEERQYQYARAGLKALFSAIRLRRLVGLPGTRLNATPWSAQPKLWNTWKEECRRRSTTSRPTPELAVLSNIQSQPPSGEQI